MILTELKEIQDQIAVTPVYELERLSALLERRALLIPRLEPTPEAHELLTRIVHESEQLQIRIQAERRQLCLDAGALRNRQRFLDSMG